MSVNPALKLASELAPAVALLELALSNGDDPRCLYVMGLRKRAAVLAADLKAALAEPLTIKPWTPFNERNSDV